MDIAILMDCIRNPVKAQILLSLKKHKCLTAKELLKILVFIPQATLYRNLKKMEKDEIIVVVSEVQKRGVIEKTYELNTEIEAIEKSIAATNDGALYADMFSYFVMELLLEFDSYSKKDKIDIVKDGSGFRAISIYATTEELTKYGKQIEQILRPAFIRKNDEQEIHTFATIVTPPWERE